MTAPFAFGFENPRLSEMNRLSILNLKSICYSAPVFVYLLFLTPVIAGPRTHASEMNQTEGHSAVSRKARTVETTAASGSGTRDSKPAGKDLSAPEAEGDSAVDLGKRTDLNLLGKTHAAGGESRRNENVQFNLIDNNALKELNIRLGTTATLIEVFQANRSYFGAEFGNNPTVPLHLFSSNHRNFHGRLYESHMNSVFSARSFFQVGDVKPARDNDYGFAVGAPLWRSSNFFMQGSQQKLHGNVNGNVLVPRADERFPLATDPAARAIVQKFLDAYPAELPNRTDINQRALNTNSSQKIDNGNFNARLDQRFGARDQLFSQYSLTSQAVVAFQLVAGQNPNTRTQAHEARITWNRQWSPQAVTDFSVGFDRVGSLLVPEKNSVGPMVSISNALETLGPSGIIPIDRAQNLFRYGGLLRKVSGPHTWNAGFEFVRRQLNGLETDSYRGYFSFGNDFGRDAITNFRMGTPTQYILALGNFVRGFRNWDLHYFAGDNWHFSPTLSVSYGLRYQPVLRPVEVNHLNTISYSTDWNNLSPFAGLSYRLPDQWGTLRTSYGLEYGQIFPVTFQQIRFSPPSNLKIVVPNPNLAAPLQDFDLSNPNIRSTTYVLDPRLVTPYSHQYNLSWETTIAGDWHLQLGYVGSRSHKLLLMWYTNRANPVPGIPQTTATVNLRRQDPRFAEIRRVINGSIGYFDAARVSLVLPRWHSWSVNASYWFSKAIDLGSSYTNTAYYTDSQISRSQSEFDQFRDMKGLSDFDQPHAFLVRSAYSFPALNSRPSWVRSILGGWTFSSVVLLKKGTPFTVASGSDAPGFGNVDANGGDRPDLLDASVLGRTISYPDSSRELLPRSAFGFIQPTDAAGSLGRNVFRKGGIRNVNGSLSKHWSLSAEKQLMFRAESINLFNSPQFAEPGRELANANFGQITNTLNDGRTFHFVLQFSF
jgi:hypothetical protein